MIVRATLKDATKLTEIALASKAYWGYTAEQIESWRDDLTVTPEMIEKCEVHKAILNGEVKGFHILNLEGQNDMCTLEFLFVSPKSIGEKVGYLLLKHAFQIALANRKLQMTLLADPNAASFYAKYGFKEVSKEKSSIPGRFLPVMEKDLLGDKE